MESNKEEAYRAKEFAEKKFHAQDMAGAKKLALKAQQMYPSLEGLPQFIAVLDVHIAAQIKINGIPDWYAVLQVDSTVEETLIKKHYRKLALFLHPDKNKSPGAEEAFKLIGEASRVLSDSTTRASYDLTRKSTALSQKKQPKTRKRKLPKEDNTNVNNSANCEPSFWTQCSNCRMHFEFALEYMDLFIICPSCKKPFTASVITHDRTSRAPPRQRNNSGSEGKENENPPQMPGQSKRSEVPKKESEPKMEKSTQMPKASNKGSQVPKENSGSNHTEKEEDKMNQKKAAQPTEDKSRNDPSRGSEVPKKQSEPKKEKYPQMSKRSNIGFQVPKENSGSNFSEKEEGKKDQKKTAHPSKGKSKKTEVKFDRSAFDRLFAGGMKKVSNDNPHQNKRPKIEVN